MFDERSHRFRLSLLDVCFLDLHEEVFNDIDVCVRFERSSWIEVLILPGPLTNVTASQRVTVRETISNNCSCVYICMQTHTYTHADIHTDTYIPRLLTTEKQAQTWSPKIRNPTVETPTNRGERVKRCPNEIRAYMYNPSFLPSFSASSTASVSRTQTVRHLGAHFVWPL